MVAPNADLGSCPCPFSKCGETCAVRKFKAAHNRDSGRRLGGKLYLICPKHGRLGADGKQDVQEFILENATMRSGEASAITLPDPTAAAPAASPRPPTAAPKTSSDATPAAPLPQKQPWGFFDG